MRSTQLAEPQRLPAAQPETFRATGGLAAPHAVVAVDDEGKFKGYFSPNDYRAALARTQKANLGQLVSSD